MATIVDAIVNLVREPVTALERVHQSQNRANGMGDALEEYVKDLFAGTFHATDSERLDAYSRTFSYLGNSVSPPDAMLRGGDAIEVKKIASPNAPLALNSSYPKQTLAADNPMISEACRRAEDWQRKDMLYVVGNVCGNRLRNISMVYGLDYCASEACYQRLKSTIRNGVNAIEGVEFAESRELGHVNRVDPLGITYLRVRGMWGIENPWTVFNYVYRRDMENDLNFMCLINDRKWNALPQTNRLVELAQAESRLQISSVRIKDPDNPARLNEAKLITYAL